MTKIMLAAALAAVGTALLPGTARADVVGCGCYCGKVLPPPCSDYACQSACGWGGGGGGYSEPPMQGVKAGTWTRHFGRKWTEGMQNCGSNPLCMMMQTTVTCIVLPIGLAVDTPVFVVKGLGYGFWGAGQGLKAIGRGIAYPFRSRPKPVKPIQAAAVAAAPAAPPMQTPYQRCAGALIAAHGAAMDEAGREAESLHAAQVKGQLDQGLGHLAGQLAETEKAAQVKDKLDTASDYRSALTDFRASVGKCIDAKHSSPEPFVDCLKAVNAAFAATLGRLDAARRVDAAKDAYQEYAEKALKSGTELAEKTASCR